MNFLRSFGGWKPQQSIHTGALVFTQDEGFSMHISAETQALDLEWRPFSVAVWFS